MASVSQPRSWTLVLPRTKESPMSEKFDSVVDDDLKSQHSYVEDQRKRPEAFTLIAPAAFVRSIRDLGYRSTMTALDELIDNSIQAGAQRVEIRLAYKPENKTEKKPDYIVVTDDGHGMEPDMIRLAVKWGGTHREGDRKGFGRYGFGLPSACVSIGRRYTVYSKVAGGKWHAVMIDIDKVGEKAAAGEKFELVARAKNPPAFTAGVIDPTKVEAGTVVVIEELDRIETGFRTAQSFVGKMMEHVGVIYRKMIPDVKFLVDGNPVQPVDPLFLDENARWYDETSVRAEAVEPIEFELPGPRGGRGRVRIRASWFPYNFHLREPEGSLNPTNHNTRFKIMRDNNGLLICRSGRQIDIVTRLPESWRASFVNFDRFWKIEIDFDPALDEYFGVTTHKQQIEISESMLDQLKNNGLVGLIKDLRKKMRKSRAEVTAALDGKAEQPRPSEEALAKTKARRSRANPSVKQVRKAEENLTRRAKERAEITGEPVEKERERLRNEAARRPYKVDFESSTDGPIFLAERLGMQYRLILNTSHRFYTDLYEPARKVPGLCSKMEAAIFILAEAELDAANDDQESFFKATRVHGSQWLADVLAEMDAAGDREDESSAEMEAEELATE